MYESLGEWESEMELYTVRKCSPSFNMALDEALLDWHSKGK